ncbi:deleted in malignant brain tumors 1 protein-like isoform X2 [Lepisosteus oculatus]|uniref:deleted in malignant brain tumors 1 protein-like isoform X2 n=1 Tax=Lepisosteus oculatus TaxID=7918 RepID=UPI00073FAFE8|nr:PREDICTED: deleted in malignant brain tumors 1 protein-like isoform X2 [Lepisosteus oculatus]
MQYFTSQIQQFHGKEELYARNLKRMSLLLILGVLYLLPHGEAINVRLVNGHNNCSGRVEVFRNGQWGTVCDDNWDINAAQVLCREVGCGQHSLIVPLHGAYYGEGHGPVILDDVKCTGTESSLLNCKTGETKNQKCDHSEDAGVDCSGPEIPRIRLVNGNNNCSGRVEVYQRGQWGTVCDDHWGKADAEVVCREVGCEGNGSSVAVHGSYYGKGSGVIHMYGGCSGNESSLLSCGAMRRFHCDHSEDVGVDCIGLETIKVRLVNGSNNCSGRVEIFHRGQWGTLCDHSWGSTTAQVACREAGCAGNGSAVAVYGAHFGQGSGPIIMTEFCSGDESSLYECGLHGMGHYGCQHTEDAGVFCSGIDTLKVRLVNGSNNCSGRVEVFHGNQWGTVCGHSWDTNGAQVLCREVGCGEAENLIPLHGAYYGEGSGPVFVQGHCTGDETSLLQCGLRTVRYFGCDHSDDASVDCSGTENIRVKLVNGHNNCSGRVEVFHKGQWGTVCDRNWNSEAARVVCREVGCGDRVSAVAVHNAHFGEGTGTSYVHGHCNGDEPSLLSCGLRDRGYSSCGHTEDAGVDCVGIENMPIRLVNGHNNCSGRLEVFLSNKWGTVCDDNWDKAAAEVVCRQMGCGVGGSAIAIHSAHFGEGSGPIMLLNHCSGNESLLQSCGIQYMEYQGCYHSEDAAVDCSGLVSPGIEVFVQPQASSKYIVICSFNVHIRGSTVYLNVVGHNNYTVHAFHEAENISVFIINEAPPVSFTCVHDISESGQLGSAMFSETKSFSVQGAPYNNCVSTKTYTAFIVIGLIVIGAIIGAVVFTELRARRRASSDEKDNSCESQELSLIEDTSPTAVLLNSS